MKIRAYRGRDQENFILAVRNNNSEFAWTIVYIQFPHDTQYRVGDFLSDKNVEKWHPMSFTWQ